MKKFIIAGATLAAVAFVIAATTAYSNYVVTKVNDGMARRIPKPVDEGQTVRLADRTLHVWAAEAKGPAPLVIFSHDFGSCGTDSSFLTSAMAAGGYIAIAPDHHDAACGIAALADDRPVYKPPGDWSANSFIDRRDDITAVLAALKAAPEWQKRIDWNNVVLAGAGLGSYTAIAVAGGWKEWRTDGIKGVLALAATCEPFTAKRGLNTLKVPVMYQTGALDGEVKAKVQGPQGCYAQTGSPKAYVEFDNAGRDAFSDRQPPFRPLVTQYSLSFLDQVTGRPDVRFEGQPGVAELRSSGLFAVKVSSQ